MNITKDFFNTLGERALTIVVGEEDGILSDSVSSACDFGESFNRKIKRMAKEGNYSLEEFLIAMETCFKVACVKLGDPEEEKYKQAIEAFLTKVDNITAGKIKKLLANPQFLEKKQEIVDYEVETARERVEQARNMIFPVVCGGEPGIVSGYQSPINVD